MRKSSVPAPRPAGAAPDSWFSPAAVVPWLALVMVVLPQVSVRLAGYALLLVWIIRDWRWGFRLVLAALPFTEAGTFELFFALKPFQIIAVLLVLSLVRAWRRGCLPARRRLPLDLLLLLFVAAMLVSVPNSDQLPASLRLLANYTSLIFVAVLFAGWYPADELTAVPRWLLPGAVIMAPVQVVSLFAEWYTRKMLPYSVVAGGSATGDYLIFVIPFLFLLQRPARLARWAWAALLALLLFNLLLTYNRGSWAAMLFIAGYALLRLRLRVLDAWRHLLSLAVAGMVLLTAALAWSPYFQSYVYPYFMQRINPAYIASGGNRVTVPDELPDRMASSEHWRLYLWKRVAGDFFVPHWLVGSGVGNIGLPHHNPPAHNNALQVAGETGLVGLTVLVLLYLRTYRSLWQVWRGGGTHAPLALACLAAFSGLLVHGCVANTLVFAQHWILPALAAVLAATAAGARGEAA